MRSELGKLLGMSTLTSQQVQMEILEEKWEIFLTARGKFWKNPACESHKVCTICSEPKHCKNVLGISDQSKLPSKFLTRMGGVFPWKF